MSNVAEGDKPVRCGTVDRSRDREAFAWQAKPMLLGVDVGGTFTDAVVAVDGRLVTAKAPTTPHDQSEGVLAAVRAALERAGARARGRAARSRTGRPSRRTRCSRAAARAPRWSPPRASRTSSSSGARRARTSTACAPRTRRRSCRPSAASARPSGWGRTGALRALEDPAALADAVAALEPEAVAVCLLHAYRHPAHEQALGAALRERLPDVHVSLSHEVVGTFREFERAATTELDAALSPLLAAYLAALAGRAAGAGLPAPDVMQSSGGLATLEQARAHAALTVLSGPAGGAAGAAWAALASGERGALCFDMGGTSCDVCVIEDGAARETGGPARRRPAGRAADARPAHGRRRRRLDRLARRGRRAARRAALGGRAARARPPTGTAGASRRSRTRTSCSGCSARARRWPARSRWTPTRPRRRSARLAGELGLEPLACAEGIRRVANAEMIRALRVMTVERGVDPRELALLAFGGAGPLHAAAIADELGMTRILCPRASGVLAALGLVVSDRRRDAQRSVLLSGAALTAAALRDEIAALGERAGAGARRVTAELRYRGQSFELAVECGEAPEPDALREAFAAAHERAYGYRDDDGEVELVTLRVTATEPGPEIDAAAAGAAGSGAARIGPARLVRRRGARGRGADRRARARHRAARARDLRAARGDARRAARLGRPRRARPGTIRLERAAARAVSRRPRHPARRLGRPARGLRGDGRGADPRRALGEHQGAPRRLVRAVRPRRPDGDAGRAHPRAPRRDAGGGRGGRRRARTSPASPGCSTTPTAAARTCPTSP